jgi:tetratricopeptide (TPR) repeat protein
MRLRSRYLAGILLTMLSASLAAQQRQSYGLDEDPIRLGEQALRAGDLAQASARFNEAIAADYRVEQALYRLAQIAVRQGRAQDAEALFRQAIARRGAAGKAFPQAKAELGLLLWRLDRRAEAEAEFGGALAADDRLWAAQYGRALLLLDSEQWEPAKKLLERGAKLQGVEQGEDQYHFGMARHALGVGELKQAERHALLAFHANPTEPAYGLLVGEIYLRGETPALAIEAFERVLATPDMAGDATLLHQLGGLYESTNRYEEARDRYLAAVRADSLHAPALKSLADLYAKARRPEQAARSYLRYLSLQADDRPALLGLAAACHELGRHPQAVEAAQRALQLQPEDVAARYAFARSGIHLRDPKLRAQAAEYFAQLADGFEWTWEDYAAVASFQVSHAAWDAAQAALDRGFAAYPDAAALHFQQGILALKTKDVETAIAHLTKVTQAEPDHALAHLNLGIAQLQAQRLADAIEPLRRAVQLDAELSTARLLLAQALAGSERLAEAETEYLAILERQPNDAAALRGVGFCRMRSSDYAAAAAHYRRATEIEPDNVEGWAGLGNASLGLSDLEGAERAFQRAQALDPEHPSTVKGLELLKRYKQSDRRG